MRGQFLLPLPVGEGWGEGLASTKCFDFLLPISHKIILKLVVDQALTQPSPRGRGLNNYNLIIRAALPFRI